MYRKLSCIASLLVTSFTLQASILTPSVTASTKSNTQSLSAPTDNKFSHRQNLLNYHPDMLFNQQVNAELNSDSIARTLQLHLFADTVINASADTVYTRQDGKTVWLGSVRGASYSTVNLIVDAKQLTGNIRLNGHIYQIRTQANGQILVVDFNAPTSKQSDVMDGLDISRKATRLAEKNAAQNPRLNPNLPLYSPATGGFTDNPETKVLVYYTDQALKQHPDLLELIDLDFIETNQALGKSNIQATVSIVDKIGIDEKSFQVGDGLSSMLQEQGAFANLTHLREKYQADLVHLYPRFQSGGFGICGMAHYAAYPNGDTFRELGLGVTLASCAGSLTTAHELGHNFGARHDRYEQNDHSEQSNFAYVDLDNTFTTVMAYPDECQDNNLSCQKIAHYSNPQVTYQLAPTGIAEPAHEAADNASQLNHSGLTIANFYGVSRPTITQISQGEQQQGVSLRWLATQGASGYRVFRSKAAVSLNTAEPLCSYPNRAEYFDTTDTQYLDSTAQAEQVYCYSVMPLNDKLLNHTHNPESFVRSGFFSQQSDAVLPFIDNIQLAVNQDSYQQGLTLPNTYDYQVSLVEHNLAATPDISLQLLAENNYQLDIKNISAANQSFTLALLGTHKITGADTAQLINVFVTGYENAVPQISVPASAQLDQQSTISLPIDLFDDQAIDLKATYVNSRNTEILKQAWITLDDNNQYQLNLTHTGYKTGQVELVVGYTDGEYSSQSVINIQVNRSIFSPTKTQNTTWYVTPNAAITRLLPFYDDDQGEVLHVDIITPPQFGELQFSMDDQVTYKAFDNFVEDSFSFQVTGEDGVSTEPVTVTLKQPGINKLAPTQKFALDNELVAFLTHQGELYTWGRNGSGQTGLTDAPDYVYSPQKVSQAQWADVAVRGQTLFAIKTDGTLWQVGYDFINTEVNKQFVQIGSDADWRSVQAKSTNGILLLTKTDGSIWARGYNANNSLSNHPSVPKDIKELTQINPIYNTKALLFNGLTGLILTHNNQLLTWGDSKNFALGRPNKMAYLGEVEETDMPISQLTMSDFKAMLLSDGHVYAWGKTREEVFFDQNDNYATPTQLGSQFWQQVALGSTHLMAIHQDGSLWTAGGSTDYATGKEFSAPLARGTQATPSLDQVGDTNNWIALWAGDEISFALDSEGQIWVAGGYDNANIKPVLGLGEDTPMVYTLTKLTGIPTDVTGTGDFDGDQLVDFADLDDDADGVPDVDDAFALDASETTDTDSDGIGNNADLDDDGDNVADSDDAFPLDATETTDTDGDGIGNNADLDDDGDNVADNDDAFPLDAAETTDTDGDGIGNNADNDDDGDGVNDNDDDYPLDASRSVKPVNLPQPETADSGGGGIYYLLGLLVLLFISKTKEIHQRQDKSL